VSLNVIVLSCWRPRGIILIVAMLNAVVLSCIMLSACILSLLIMSVGRVVVFWMLLCCVSLCWVLLCWVLFNIVVLYGIILIVIMLSCLISSAILLSCVMLNLVALCVIVLKVMAPLKSLSWTECRLLFPLLVHNLGNNLHWRKKSFFLVWSNPSGPIACLDFQIVTYLDISPVNLPSAMVIFFLQQ